MCLGCVAMGERVGRILDINGNIGAANDNLGDKVAMYSKDGNYDLRGYRSVADYVRSLGSDYNQRYSNDNYSGSEAEKGYAA
jgi:hypothetical protein